MKSQAPYWQWNACYSILFSSMKAWSRARFKIYLLPKLGPFFRNALTFQNSRNKNGSRSSNLQRTSGKQNSRTSFTFKFSFVMRIYKLSISFYSIHSWALFCHPISEGKTCTTVFLKELFSRILSLYLISDKEIIFGIENWQLMEGRCKFDDCYPFSKSTVKLQYK